MTDLHSLPHAFQQIYDVYRSMSRYLSVDKLATFLDPYEEQLKGKKNDEIFAKFKEI